MCCAFSRRSFLFLSLALLLVFHPTTVFGESFIVLNAIPANDSFQLEAADEFLLKQALKESKPFELNIGAIKLRAKENQKLLHERGARVSVRGWLTGESGETGTYIVSSARVDGEEAVSGVISLDDGRRFTVEGIGRGLSVCESDPSSHLGCGIEGHEHRPLSKEQLESAYPEASELSASGGNPEIDLMVAYTRRARVERGSTASMLAAIDTAVLGANETYEHSGLPQRIRLVKTHELEADGTRGSLHEDLDDITSGSKWAEAREVRDRYGIDMLVVVVASDTAEWGGRAWILQSSSPNRPFSVVVADQLTNGSHILPHELGHNMGAGHEVGNEYGSTGYFNDSHGKRFSGQSGQQHRTLMAYPPGNLINQFSSPSILFDGVSTGSSSSADNASTLAFSAPIIAGTKTPGLAPDRVRVYPDTFFDLDRGTFGEAEADLWMFPLPFPLSLHSLTINASPGLQWAELDGVSYEEVTAETLDGVEFSTTLDLFDSPTLGEVYVFISDRGSYYKLAYINGTSTSVQFRYECIQYCGADHLRYGADYLNLDTDLILRGESAGDLYWELGVSKDDSQSPSVSYLVPNADDRLNQGLEAVLIANVGQVDFSTFDWDDVPVKTFFAVPLELNVDDVYIVSASSGKTYAVRIAEATPAAVRLEYRRIVNPDEEPLVHFISVLPWSYAYIAWTNVSSEAWSVRVQRRLQSSSTWSTVFTDTKIFNPFGGGGELQTSAILSGHQLDRTYCYRVITSTFMGTLDFISEESCLYFPKPPPKPSEGPDLEVQQHDEGVDQSGGLLSVSGR